MSDDNKKRWISLGKTTGKIIGSVLACLISALPVIRMQINQSMQIATEQMKIEIQNTLEDKFKIYDGAIFIIVYHRLKSIDLDLNSEFADDVRKDDIESALGLYGLLSESLKTPGMDLMVENIKDKYKNMSRREGG